MLLRFDSFVDGQGRVQPEIHANDVTKQRACHKSDGYVIENVGYEAVSCFVVHLEQTHY